MNSEAGETRIRTTPIHISLTRPVLLAGADRELTLVNVVVILALLFGIGVSRWTIVLSVVLATVGQWALGRVARYDPEFRRVYLRHIKLQPYYPGAASVRASAPVIHPSLPYSE